MRLTKPELYNSNIKLNEFNSIQNVVEPKSNISLLKSKIKWDHDKEKIYRNNRSSISKRFHSIFTACPIIDASVGWYYNDLRISVKNKDLRLFL